VTASQVSPSKVKHHRSLLSRVVAIYGPPGAGKTTTAMSVVKEFDGVYISSGDIAREVDPDALKRGQMADRVKLREGFMASLDVALRLMGEPLIVCDGIPRDPTDIELFDPEQTTFILLNVRPDIAIDRQLRRGRPDDTRDIIIKRTTEQRALMQMDDPDGWPWYLSAWNQRLTTDHHRPEEVARFVADYLLGFRRSVG
jgi:adenylate kinase family enzyme